VNLEAGQGLFGPPDGDSKVVDRVGGRRFFDALRLKRNALDGPADLLTRGDCAFPPRVLLGSQHIHGIVT
jgi:hypothetical protein